MNTHNEPLPELDYGQLQKDSFKYARSRLKDHDEGEEAASEAALALVIALRLGTNATAEPKSSKSDASSSDDGKEAKAKLDASKYPIEFTMGATRNKSVDIIRQKERRRNILLKKKPSSRPKSTEIADTDLSAAKVQSSNEEAEVNASTTNYMSTACYFRSESDLSGDPSLIVEALERREKLRELFLSLPLDKLIHIGAKATRTSIEKVGSGFGKLALGENALTTYYARNKAIESAKTIFSAFQQR